MGQTDGQTPDRSIDHAQHTVRGVASTIAIFLRLRLVVLRVVRRSG